MEHKFIKLEIKSLDELGLFQGHGSVFRNKDLGRDIVDTGAFKRTIQHHKGIVPMLFNHDTDREIAITKSLEEDNTGLNLSAQLYISDDPKMDLPDARNTYIKMKRRSEANKPIGLSIGYDTMKEDTEIEPGFRHIKEIRLWEISVVTFPMNVQATVENVKSMGTDLEFSLEGILEIYAEIKEGRVLSSSNVELLSKAIEALQALLQASAKVPVDDPVVDLSKGMISTCRELAMELRSMSIVRKMHDQTNSLRI